MKQHLHIKACAELRVLFVRTPFSWSFQVNMIILRSDVPGSIQLSNNQAILYDDLYNNPSYSRILIGSRL